MKKEAVPKGSPIRKKKITAEISSPDNSFYAVGIGASAGGLDALERFFGNLTEVTGTTRVELSGRATEGRLG